MNLNIYSKLLYIGEQSKHDAMVRYVREQSGGVEKYLKIKKVLNEVVDINKLKKFKSYMTNGICISCSSKIIREKIYIYNENDTLHINCIYSILFFNNLKYIHERIAVAVRSIRNNAHY